VTSVLAVEALTSIFVVALVTFASFLRRPPSLGLGLALIAMLLFMFPTVLALAKWNWNRRLWIFLPYVWSMGERFRQLWTFPRASQLEKLRTRALAYDRFQTGFFGFLGVSLLGIGSIMVSDNDDLPHRAGELLLPISLALVLAIACIDQIRVHGKGFARSPRRLWAKPGRPDPALAEIKPI
jgi:hypothetical protein